MVYYTPLFAAHTHFIPDFVAHQISKTNQGYINSKIPVRVKLHCIEEASIEETSDGFTYYRFFGWKLENVTQLRNSADAVTLFGGVFK